MARRYSFFLNLELLLQGVKTEFKNPTSISKYLMARKMQCLSVIIYYHYKALCRHTSFLFSFLRTSIADPDEMESYAPMDTSHFAVTSSVAPVD